VELQFIYDILSQQRESNDKVVEEKGFRISLTTNYSCNYSCDYCYQVSTKHMTDRIEPIDIQNINVFYDQLCEHYGLENRFHSVGIMGGEALLPKNSAIMENVFLNWADAKFIITTNGVHIEYYKSLLANHNIELRISLDGDEETHYQHRKPQNKSFYRKTLEGVNWAVNKGIPISIMTVFNPDNITRYMSFFTILESLGWRTKPNIDLYFIAQKDGACDDINPDYLYRSMSAIQELKRMDERAHFARFTGIVPGIATLISSLKKPTESLLGYRCTALNNYGNYVFDPSGKVYICNVVPNDEFVVGTFRPNVDINYNRINYYKNRTVKKMEKCIECNVKNFCRGGCTISAYLNEGNPLSPSCGFWKDQKVLDFYDQTLSSNYI